MFFVVSSTAYKYYSILILYDFFDKMNYTLLGDIAAMQVVITSPHSLLGSAHTNFLHSKLADGEP